MTRLALLTLALGVLAAASGALAQPGGRPSPARRGELALFSDTQFRGRTFFVHGPTTSLTVPFIVRSFAMAPGESWLLCSRPNYGNPCNHFDQSDPNRGPTTILGIRSARPTVTAPEFPGAGPAGPSLQGMASEFFRAPEVRGVRVRACLSGPETATCAADTAGRFCRARGYAGGSAFQRMETVRGQTFLADVLCSRSGG